MNLRTASVVGTGSISSRYLRVLAGLLGGRPVAVPVSGHLRNANPASMADVEGISCANRPRLDLLVIASATESPVQNFQSFRDTACVALVEKPLAASADALEAVQPWPAIASALVAAPLRFTQGLQEVERVLPEVGRKTSMNVVCWSWLPIWRPQSDCRVSCSADVDHGGVLLDLIHETDYCLHLFGAPLQVGAILRSGTVIEVRSDASTTCELTFEEKEPAIGWNALDASVTAYDHDQGTCLVESFPDDLNRDLLLQREIMAAVDSQLAGRSCTFEEARLSLQVCDIARRSSIKGGQLMELGAAL